MSKNLKNLIFQLHLWSGLIAGIFIFLICLSGTILTFDKEFKNFSNPGENLYINPAIERKSLEELAKIMADKGEVQSISVGENDRPYMVNIKASPEDRRGKNFAISPVDGEVLNDPNYKHSIMMFFFKLHRWLLGDAESFGKILVGIATIVMGFLTLTGLYLWWPKNIRILKTVLKINMKNSKRMIYDLHNTLGFYSLIPVLVMILTGLCWSFGWYRDGLSTVLNAKVFGDRRTDTIVVEQQETMLSLDQLLANVNSKLPYDGAVTIPVKIKVGEAIVIRKTPTSGLRYTDFIYINPYNGDVVAEKLFKSRSFGDQISSLIRPLHTGEFYGMLSKIIYFICCLIATSLPVTGTWMWYKKLKLKKKA